MVVLKFENTLCFKENCIHIDRNYKVCKLNGMSLESLRPSFRCGNLNNLNTKRNYFPKPETIFESIDLIEREDPKFQEFFSLFNKEIERIFSNLKESHPNNTLLNPETIPNELEIIFGTKTEIIFESKFFHQFGQLDDNFNKIKQKLYSVLFELLPYSNDNIEIWISLDSRLYNISIGEIYDNLIETAMKIYITNKESFETLILELINNWRESFNSRILTYELIIPLKGLNFSDLNWDNLVGKNLNDKLVQEYIEKTSFRGYKFLENQIEINGNDKIISTYLKPPLAYSLFKINKSPSSHRFHICYILVKSYCPFIFRGYVKAPNINEDILWNHLKRIFQVFYVCGIKLDFGKPFYKFPWWISKKLVQSFSFPVPNYMDTNSMWMIPIEKLIPDFFPIKFGFFVDINKPRNRTRDIILGKSEILGESIVMKGSGQYTRSLSKLTEIKDIYFKLTNFKLSINHFENNITSFLLDNLLRLAQRTDIREMIVDAWTILETIGSSEISKLFIIISIIRSETKTDFINHLKKYSVLFDKLYKTRNKIVHGSTEWEKFYIKYAKALFKDNSISYEQATKSKKNLIIKWTYETIAEIIKDIILKDLNIENLRKKSDFINCIP